MKIIKKSISIFLVLVLALSIIPMTNFAPKVNATSKTVDEALNWVRAQSGKSLDVDGYPTSQPYQCVDFVKLYYSYLGVNSVTGNGCDYATNSLPDGWDRKAGGTPQPGDILVYTGNDSAHKAGHVAIYEASNAIWHQNWGYSYVIKTTNKSYNSLSSALTYWGYVRPNFSGSSSSVSFNAAVEVAVDGVTIDKVTSPYYGVGGWAFCSDKSDTTVYWCIDDKEAYVASKYDRTDVVNAYGCRIDCGFDFSIPIKDLSIGQHKLSIWVNSSSGSADIKAAYFNVTSSDTTPPVVENVALSNELDNFTVTCGVSDDYGISKVEFAVWTAYNGQDDLKIHTGNISGDGYAWCVVNNSEHNYETGTYYVDIYAYDNSNNSTFKSTYEVYVGNMIVLHGITNADGSDAYIDINGTPTLTGERRFWFYNYNLDPHYYINVYVDGNIVLDHVASDSGRYVSYVLDTGALTDGLHTITAVMADSNGSFNESKEFYVNNLIAFTGISEINNTGWIDINGTPTISGTKKIWFKKESSDTNYYIDMYVDGVKVESHKSTDASGSYSYAVDTTKLSNGKHTFRAELFDSKTYYTATKTVIVNNPQYTLTFNANGGKCSTASKIIVKNSTYGTLPTPTRDGYSFDGWYTAASGGTKITADTKVTVTGNQTLYAHWTCKHAKYNSSVTKEATCTATGVKTYTCTTCSHTYTETIPATKHSYKSVVTAPTCTAEGYTTYTCSKCSDTYTGDKVSATGHSFGEWNVVTKATCTKAGLKERVCTCGEKETEAIPATNHSYKSVVTAPTCTAEGYTTYTCSKCSDTYTGDKVSATGHSFGEWNVVTKATCTTAGLKERVCPCGEKEAEVIPATGHSFGKWGVVYIATCQDEGLEERVCTCGEKETKTIAKISHTDSDNDGYCDECDYETGNSSSGSNKCSHLCHSKNAFIAKLIWPIVRFFIKLFGTNPVCTCGASHY